MFSYEKFQSMAFENMSMKIELASVVERLAKLEKNKLETEAVETHLEI